MRKRMQSSTIEDLPGQLEVSPSDPWEFVTENGEGPYKVEKAWRCGNYLFVLFCSPLRTTTGYSIAYLGGIRHLGVDGRDLDKGFALNLSECTFDKETILSDVRAAMDATLERAWASRATNGFIGYLRKCSDDSRAAQ